MENDMLTARQWVQARRLSRHINHTYFAGNPRHCLSTRIHMERWVAAEFLVDCLFIAWGWGHCRQSYQREVIHDQEAQSNHQAQTHPQTCRETNPPPVEALLQGGDQ